MYNYKIKSLMLLGIILVISCLTACGNEKVVTLDTILEHNEERIETDNVQEYISHMSNLDTDNTSSNFILYPRIGLENMNIEECYFYSENGLLDTYYQMYMKCTFTKEEYENEVSRLESIEIEEEKNVYRPIFVESIFDFPAYVSIFTKYDYEYALMDSNNNTIIYVYNRISDIQSGNIPAEYLPRTEDVQAVGGEYNMYYSYSD